MLHIFIGANFLVMQRAEHYLVENETAYACVNIHKPLTPRAFNCFIYIIYLQRYLMELEF